MNGNDGVRRPFLYLTVVVLTLGIAAFVFSWMKSPPIFSAEFAFLLVAGLISENFAVEMGEYSFSIAYPLVLAALILCGPTPALILAIATSVNLIDVRNLHWSVTVFNIGQLLFSSALAAGAYVALGGRVLLASGIGPFGASDFPAAFVPLLATAVAGSVGNIALASLGVSVKSGERIGNVLESVGWLPIGQLALGVVGFTIAQVMAINIAAFLFFIFPLLVARQFHQRFLSLHSVFTDTIRSLIGALEAKDPYTRGHSERVAKYAVLLGRALAFEPRELGDLEKAALLHDLGKLALPGELLRKVGRLEPHEWDEIRRHPSNGAEMISKIPPLRRLAEPVLCHHERLDGSGYPNGLRGAELSSFARILAIADSYDAMTSDRPYRRGFSRLEAATELRRCAGIQLDSAYVEAFIDTLLDEPEEIRETLSAHSHATVQGEA